MNNQTIRSTRLIVYATVAAVQLGCGGSHDQTNDFFTAVNQTKAQYPVFEGYEALENEAELVVEATPVSLAKGPTWRFNYGNPSLEQGQRNSVILVLRVDEVLKGEAREVVHVRFDTGLADGSQAGLPQGKYRLYLMKAPGAPGFDDPGRGLPANTSSYLVVRPEGLVNLDAPEAKNRPLLGDAEPIAPLSTNGPDARAARPATKGQPVAPNPGRANSKGQVVTPAQ